MKNFSPTFSALGDYDIKKIYIEKESLDERGLSVDDLQDLTWEDEDNDYEEKSFFLRNRYLHLPKLNPVNRQLKDLFRLKILFQCRSF